MYLYHVKIDLLCVLIAHGVIYKAKQSRIEMFKTVWTLRNELMCPFVLNKKKCKFLRKNTNDDVDKNKTTQFKATHEEQKNCIYLFKL